MFKSVKLSEIMKSFSLSVDITSGGAVLCDNVQRLSNGTIEAKTIGEDSVNITFTSDGRVYVFAPIASGEQGMKLYKDALAMYLRREIGINDERNRLLMDELAALNNEENKDEQV